jgi:hypothetical protein
VQSARNERTGEAIAYLRYKLPEQPVDQVQQLAGELGCCRWLWP